MKTKIYLLTTFVFLALAVSAQKYNVMLVAGWINNTWVDTLKTTNTYDSNGNLIQLITQTWNPETSGWDNALIMSHTLNDDGTIKETLTRVWYEEDWMNAFKIIYTYSPSKKVLTQTSQLSLEGNWMDMSVSSYTYNDNDLPVTMVTSVFGIVSEQITYTYNPDGTEHQQIYQNWSGGQWENFEQTTNSYNDSKQLIGSLEEKWENETLVNNTRSTIAYNEAGSIIESKEQIWLANTWVDGSKEMYSYNATGELQQMISQEWNAELAQWENKVRASYDYNPTGINPVELTAKTFVVFPNPFEDQLTIKASSLDEHVIRVFNSSGQLINTFTTSQSITNLNLGDLKQGAYFMKITSPQNEQTFKLLKTR